MAQDVVESQAPAGSRQTRGRPWRIAFLVLLLLILIALAPAGVLLYRNGGDVRGTAGDYRRAVEDQWRRFEDFRRRAERTFFR
jgi:hypothetical protein